MANDAFTIRRAREASGASVGTLVTPPEMSAGYSLTAYRGVIDNFRGPDTATTISDHVLGSPREIIQAAMARTPLPGIQQKASEALGEVKP